jgi:hypothetical protein
LQPTAPAPTTANMPIDASVDTAVHTLRRERGWVFHNRLKRILRVVLPAIVLVGASLASTSNAASAYGAPDKPLAQIEFSANCNNPDFGLCQQVGLGGIWLWIEIDSNQTGDVAGAGCGHVRGVGGGAGPIKGDISWSYATAAQAIAAGAFLFAADPSDKYYLVALNPFEKFAFPTTRGHYSFRPAPAVTIQLQIAP